MISDREKIEKIFDFLSEVENLKSTCRYNFTKTGRKESSADHSWRLSLIVMIVALEMKLDVDVDKAVRIAIVHDIAESVTGDIDAVEIDKGNVSREEKERQEKEAIDFLRKKLPSDSGQMIYDLWDEYERGETEEAKFVKALDKIETTTQLVEAGYKVFDYPDYIPTYPDKHVKRFPKLLGMLKILKGKLKEEFKKGKLKWRKEFELGE
jgi:putative hydrolase of HD superfamily